MSDVVSSAPTIEAYEADLQAMVGVQIESVIYWGLNTYGADPEPWDYGDWHHAVLGVEIDTNAGPRFVTWTSRFYPYGVEILSGPPSAFLRMAEDGPRASGPDHDLLGERFVGPILSAAVQWEPIHVGPAHLSSGEVVSPARDIDVPIAIRLDFESGPIWLVAGIPQPDGRLFVGGDEIVVVLSAARMEAFGFRADAFIR